MNKILNKLNGTFYFLTDCFNAGYSEYVLHDEARFPKQIIFIKERKDYMSQFIVLIVLIFVNAFFAATEMAFVSLNDAKITIKFVDKKEINKHGNCDSSRSLGKE